MVNPEGSPTATRALQPSSRLAVSFPSSSKYILNYTPPIHHQFVAFSYVLSSFFVVVFEDISCAMTHASSGSQSHGFKWIPLWERELLVHLVWDARDSWMAEKRQRLAHRRRICQKLHEIKHGRCANRASAQCGGTPANSAVSRSSKYSGCSVCTLFLHCHFYIHV